MRKETKLSGSVQDMMMIEWLLGLILEERRVPDRGTCKPARSESSAGYSRKSFAGRRPRRHRHEVIEAESPTCSYTLGVESKAIDTSSIYSIAMCFGIAYVTLPGT